MFHYSFSLVSCTCPLRRSPLGLSTVRVFSISCVYLYCRYGVKSRYELSGTFSTTVGSKPEVSCEVSPYLHPFDPLGLNDVEEPFR